MSDDIMDRLEVKISPAHGFNLVRRADAEQKIGSVIVPHGGMEVESGMVVKTCPDDHDEAWSVGDIVFWQRGHAITVGEHDLVPCRAMVAWQAP